MVNVLGEFVPSKTMTYKWADEFKRVRTSIEEDSRAGLPKSASNSEDIKKIQDMVSENH